MTLLICTQKVDKDDPILGFFHRWIEEFSKNFEKIIVICLEKGKYTLPQNVKVLSLGKETGKSRIKYLKNFYKYIWQERKNYDSVFVHMNQEYVLLGGLFWRLWQKNLSLWRNHAKGNIFTRIAVILSNRVFCTSPQSFTARFKKTRLMPVGIDTDFFKPDSSVQKIPHSILFLGRIAPIKKQDIFIESLAFLYRKGDDFTVSIYGNSLPKNKNYHLNLKKRVKELGIEDKVFFNPAVPHHTTPRIYTSHSIFVNLSPDGLYDKTIFEAMASGTLIISTHSNLRLKINSELILEECNPEHLARLLDKILHFDPQKSIIIRDKLRAYVANSHDITILANRLKKELENNV